MNVQLNNIPDELKARRQFVAWRYEPDPERPKPRKCPINPHTGGRARPNVSSTWGTFEQAIEAMERGKLDGIGYTFHQADPYVGIDFDDCRDPITGNINLEAWHWLVQLDSYAEVSCSLTGAHVLVKSGLPKGIKRG